MSNILSALICLKQVIGRSKSQNKNWGNQVVQSVYPLFPNDKVLNKIIKMFVNSAHGHDYINGKYYSRAIMGKPICALVRTDKENWLLAMTRSVKVEWPKYDFSNERMVVRILDTLSKKNHKKYAGRVYGCHVHSVNFDEAMKESSKEAPFVLRKTECPDFLVFPMNGKRVESKKGFRIQQKESVLFKALNSSEYRKRVEQVFTLKTLSKLWEVYSTVEKDPKLYEKYLKGEIVGEPADYNHPVVRFHATAYETGFSDAYGGRGSIPGVLPVDVKGNVCYGKTRFEIPAPEKEQRLLYKSETPLLSSLGHKMHRFLK